MAILKSLIVNGVTKLLSDVYLSVVKAGTWNGSTIGVAYGGTGVTSALGNATTPVYLSSTGLTLCNAYPTKSSWNYDDTYVKLNPGTAEQTIKSTISSLSKGIVNFWRNSGDHYTFVGFSNGTTEKFLGGIGFKSLSDHNLYLKYCSDGNVTSATNYYKIWDEHNDGSGSGLDADLLDGQLGSYYAAASSLSNYLPLTGGTLSSSGNNIFNINNSTSNATNNWMYFNVNNTNKVFVGLESNKATLGLSNSYRIYIDSSGNFTLASSGSDASPKTIIHSGNISNYVSDTKVTQTAITSNGSYEVLLSGTADNTTRTEGANKTNTFTYNPSTDNLTVGEINNVRLYRASIGTTTLSDFDTSIFGRSDNSNYKLSVIRMSESVPDYFELHYSSGIAWKGSDTKGAITVGYLADTPSIKFAGGNGTGDPLWWMLITGTASTTYNLDKIKENKSSDVLFSLLPYLENGWKLLNLSPIVSIGSAPYGKCYGPYTASREFKSDYISVLPGDLLYGEAYAYRESNASGTASTLYYGIERYDKNKKQIASNYGTEYFVASGVTVPTNSTWTKYSGTTTIPTSHTAYNGSDGGGVYYIRLRFIVDYNVSSGGIPTYIGKIILRRGGSIVQKLTTSSNTNFRPVILGLSNNSSNSFSTVSDYLCSAHNIYVKPSTGDFYVGGNYYTNSDINLKHILSTPKYNIEQFASLPLIKYTWKDEEDDKIKLGSIALDVELNFPELVKENKDGHKSVDYAVLGTIGVISLAKELILLKEEINCLKQKLYG